MSDYKFDTDYLEVGDIFEGSPIEQSYFISAVMAAGGEIEIDGNKVVILQLPKKEVPQAKAPVSVPVVETAPEPVEEKVPEPVVEEPPLVDLASEEAVIEEPPAPAPAPALAPAPKNARKPKAAPATEKTEE